MSPAKTAASASRSSGRLFSEIKFGRGGKPETVVAEINGIEILFEDFVFGVSFFQLSRQFEFF